MAEYLRGTYGGAVECRLVWRTLACLPKEQPHGWVETVGAGVQRQAASNRCWVGPSSLMNASDLDVHSFNDAVAFGIGVKAHCPQRQKIQN